MVNHTTVHERRVRMQKILRVLKKLFEDAHIALNYKTNFELLVAVILSAQCTDKRVNHVTEHLFKKYRTLDDYVHASSREFERDIKSTGFYKNKAKHILMSARMLQEEFYGAVPQTMNEIMKLPGVGRKTANVVLSNAYGIIHGIAVDTHVRRLSLKLDLTSHTEPNKIEQDLMKLIPKKEWPSSTYRFIEYGRKICPARKHDCAGHPLTEIYPPAKDKWPRAA